MLPKDGALARGRETVLVNGYRYVGGKMDRTRVLDFIPSYKGLDLFDTLDTLAANNLLLIGGACSAIFFGWFVPKALKLDEINVEDGLFFGFWRIFIRFVIPPILIITLVMGIMTEPG